MPCSSPNMMLHDARYKGISFKGPRSQEIHFPERYLQYYEMLHDVPCGKCELCLVAIRYEKALRIMLEADSWPGKTYFITLTYNNESHGVNSDLDHSHWSQFIKNFRQKFCQAKYCKLKNRGTRWEKHEYTTTFKKIKQVMSGEYGDSFGRKHFHGIIFNHSFTDVYFTGYYSKKGNPICSSPSLESVWGKGNVQLEEVNFDLALYVGAYITDKEMDGENPNEGHQKKQYGRFGNGIGLTWLKKYYRAVLSSGKVMLHDRDYAIPRYFDKKLRELWPVEYYKFKQKKLLKFLQKKPILIKKEDGPLRRAKAKGRIFKSINKKRKQDGQI